MSEQKSTGGNGPSNPNPPQAPAAPSAQEHGPGARRTRRPFGSQEQRLSWPPIPGFHTHFFNDDPGRLRQAEEAGYEFVDDHDGKRVSHVVGTNRAGGPLIAYLMKIPMDWYREDMAAVQARVDRTDAAIRRGQIQSQAADDHNNFYAEAQGRHISMSEGSGRLE